MTKEQLSKLYDLVYTWGTYNEAGFNKYEEDLLLDIFGKDKLHMDKYNNAMMGNTCMMDQHGFIMYHCDVLSALSCAIENREQTWFEWD